MKQFPFCFIVYRDDASNLEFGIKNCLHNCQRLRILWIKSSPQFQNVYRIQIIVILEPSRTQRPHIQTIKKPTYFLALGVLAPTQSLYAESTQYQSRPSTFLCLHCLSPVQKYHKTFLQASPLCRETSQMMEEKVLSGHLSTDIPSEKLKKNRVTHPITYVHLDFIM